jgi:hypothetical protein
MSRRIRVEGHLSTEELQQRYRSATHPTEKMHWQVLWLVAKGDSAEEVAEVTTYTARLGADAGMPLQPRWAGSSSGRTSWPLGTAPSSFSRAERRVARRA